MRIKSFIASTVQAALANVKREMGDSSIILETRNIEEGDIKSKAGQILVEVVAAENISGRDENRNSDHNMDQSHGQDVQSDNDGLNPESSGRHQSDFQQPGRHSPELFQVRNGQTSLSVNRNGNGTLADHLSPEDLVEMADLSTTVRKPDWQIHPNGNGRTDQVKEGGVGQVSESAGDQIIRTGDSVYGKSVTHTGLNIQNDKGNLNSQLPGRHQIDSSQSDQDSPKPCSTGNGRKDRPDRQMDSDILADCLLSDDLIRMADYSTDEGSVQDDRQEAAADEYQKNLSVKDEAIHRLTVQVDKQKAAADGYQKGMSVKDKTIHRLTVQVDKQKAAADGYQKGMSVKDETIHRLTAQVDKQKAAADEYQKSLSEKDEAINQLTAQIDKQKAAADEYQNGLSEKDETINQLTAQIDKQKAAADEYQNGLSVQDETVHQFTTPLVHHQNNDVNDGWTEIRKELYKQLRIQQVEKEHSRILINEVLSRQNGNDSRKIDVQRLMIRESIMNKIKIPAPDSNGQEKCKTMAFIGAAGTGKTTTILKLASDIQERTDKDILLISIREDFAGILNKMSGLIEATLLTASTPQELREIIDEYRSNSHIFIDTPGVNHFDKDALSSLKEYLDEVPDLETHLVVSAAARYIDIINIVKKFNVFPVHRLLFTKVDETDLYGTLFSVAEETQIPLSYVTDGQEIPDDIRPATAEMVAEMVMRI